MTTPRTTALGAVRPEPGYGINVVERRAGHERHLEEHGGDRTTAHYIEAAETSDEAQRQAIMDEIIAYNRQDLEATWAVLQLLYRVPGYGSQADIAI